MKFIVIGGDAAGMSAASRAKRHNPDMEIIVLEMTQDVSYSACGMPYNIADTGRDIDDLVVRKAKVFREKQNIDLRLGHMVTKIDPVKKEVSGTDKDQNEFALPYDALLIATGASPKMLDVPGTHYPGVHVLKSLSDGRKIKSYLRENQVKRVVIAGMGYIGLEMCESLRKLDLQVDMVKPGDAFIPWTHPELSGAVQEEVENHGVNLHMGQNITEIQKDGERLIIQCTGMDLPCEMLLVAIGITPNSRLAKEAGLSLGPEDAIAVDKSMETSCDGIWSAGDCADAFHVVTGKKVWIPLALRANRGGWAVADNVSGKRTELPGVAGTAVFKVFDMEVARTGLTEKEAMEAGFSPASVAVTTRSKAHAHPGNQPVHLYMIGDRKTGRLLGAQMVGKDGVAHRINAAAVALHAGMTVEGFAQSDLAYAPPFGPVWDPLLTCANQLIKEL